MGDAHLLVFDVLAISSYVGDSLLVLHVSNSGLVSMDLALLEPVELVALNVLAHVVMNLTDGAWWAVDRIFIVFLLDLSNFIIQRVGKSAASFVTDLNMSTVANGNITNVTTVLGVTWDFLIHCVVVLSAEAFESSGREVFGEFAVVRQG